MCTEQEINKRSRRYDGTGRGKELGYGICDGILGRDSAVKVGWEEEALRRDLLPRGLALGTNNERVGWAACERRAICGIDLSSSHDHNYNHNNEQR